MECLLLGRSRSGVGAGVGVDIFSPESESESESLKIRRLRSPAGTIVEHAGFIVADYARHLDRTCDCCTLYYVIA